MNLQLQAECAVISFEINMYFGTHGGQAMGQVSTVFKEMVAGSKKFKNFNACR